MVNYINDFLIKTDLDKTVSDILSQIITLIIIALLIYIMYIVLRGVLRSVFERIIKRTSSTWDDVLLERKVIAKFSNFIVAILSYSIVDLSSLTYLGSIKKIISIYIIGIVTYIVALLLTCVNDIYNKFEVSKNRPIKGIIQVVQIVVYVFGGIVLISNLLNQDLTIIISGLGALSAVAMLVFKDSLLGLVAGIQITTNNMVKIGDCITIPSINVTGTVIDISLNSVTIQTFDNSIATVPAYDLVSKTFSNFKGIVEKNSRRMKRVMYVDINSIKFLDEKMIERFKNVNYLKEYINKKSEEINKYNDIHRANNDEEINLRKLTNLGTFRIYINNYLKYNENINPDFGVLVRQLDHSPNGVPIEIYAFVNTSDWGKSEEIQTNIFEHIYSIAKEFDITLAQNPVGKDFDRINK